jgi:hypothetical protein
MTLVWQAKRVYWQHEDRTAQRHAQALLWLVVLLPLPFQIYLSEVELTLL